MRKEQRRNGESSQRCAHFIVANVAILGPLDTSPAGQQLTDANAQVASLAAQQDAFARDLSGHAVSDKQLVIVLRTEHILPIAKFARASLRGAPGYGALTRSGSDLRGSALVAVATGMATAAAPFLPQLTAAQFPADTVQQLIAASNALAAALADRAAARGARIRVTADLKAQLKRAREAVAMLDSIVTKKLAGQPALFAEWRSAKRVTAPPSFTAVPPLPATGAATHPATVPTQVPVSTPTTVSIPVTVVAPAPATTAVPKTTPSA
jgi:hypothetical protein